MAGKSNIEWTEQTWNPIVGCSIVSPGCTNCYAMKMAARIEAMGNQPRYAGTTKKVKGNAVWTGKLATAPESALLAPLRRKKPTTYFVNSMGDLFHEDCPDEWIDRVFAVMAMSPQHTFQVLTKRAKRMRDYMRHPATFDRIVATYSRLERKGPNSIGTPSVTLRALLEERWPLPSVWLGVSTERQQEVDERIPLLLQTPAAVRFISAEPLLGPIDLTSLSVGDDLKWNSLGGRGRQGGVDWVIVGGESGPGSREFKIEWGHQIIRDCREAGAACFVKQIGATPTLNGKPFGLQFSRKGGDPDEWPAYLNVREMPSVTSA